MPDPTIPVVYVVFNGPLEMSAGKMAAQAVQVCQRLHAEAAFPSKLYEHRILGTGPQEEARARLAAWYEHTTTVVRYAKTPAMWERVKAEVEGVVMVDEGFTEVEPGSETCFASWPLLLADVPKILSNSKVPLL